MTELHPTNGPQSQAEALPKALGETGTTECRSIGRTSDSTPPLNRFILQKWDVLALWTLVAISFAAFFIAGCVLWAKCHVR